MDTCARILLLCYVVCGAFCTSSSAIQPALLKKYPESVVQMAQKETVEELLSYHGYPHESYQVETEDGYLLALQRMPNPDGHPIFLMHGMQSTAINWLIMGPWSDLAYLLHDQGYDVWLGNARGSISSRKHVNLRPDVDEQFWNFSWHEIGVKDLPAMIDFILKKNARSSLTYVGHSQGCTAFFVMASLKPEYNQKVHMMHALAPAVYIRLPHSLSAMSAAILGKVFKYPFLFELNLKPDVVRHSCLNSQAALKKCFDTLAPVIGSDWVQLNKTMQPVMVYHFPAGASLRQGAHFYQVYKTGVFAPFDAGYWLRGIPEATPYPLEQVTVPVALYYCKNDRFVGVKEVQKLAAELPNVVEDYLIPMADWNHLDPTFAMNARTELYMFMLEVQNKNTKSL